MGVGFQVLRGAANWPLSAFLLIFAFNRAQVKSIIELYKLRAAALIKCVRPMLYYVLICLALVLTGVAGLQMSYMFYLDRLDKDRKQRLRLLERRCKALTLKLEQAQRRIDEQEELLRTAYFDDENSDADVWADVIEDR